MSPEDNASDQEPSIEEILASIRQIIADDEEEEEGGAAPETDSTDDEAKRESDLELGGEAEEAPIPAADPVEEPEPEPIPAAEPEPEPVEAAPKAAEDDVLDLTADMEDKPAEPEPEPEDPGVTPERDDIEIDMPEAPADDKIISDVAAAATLDSLSKLTGSMPINRREGYDGVTVEDIVRQLLHPMLREWVDGNLPPMVERLVEKEIKKLARRAEDI